MFIVLMKYLELFVSIWGIIVSFWLCFGNILFNFFEVNFLFLVGDIKGIKYLLICLKKVWYVFLYIYLVIFFSGVK